MANEEERERETKGRRKRREITSGILIGSYATTLIKYPNI
jgi:hypothetical protein